MSKPKGGFKANPESLKKAQKAAKKLLGREPMTSKEYSAWRAKKIKESRYW